MYTYGVFETPAFHAVVKLKATAQAFRLWKTGSHQVHVLPTPASPLASPLTNIAICVFRDHFQSWWFFKMILECVVSIALTRSWERERERERGGGGEGQSKGETIYFTKLCVQKKIDAWEKVQIYHVRPSASWHTQWKDRNFERIIPNENLEV